MALISAGETAPAFSLPNQDGGSVSLSELTGKYVLIWWYPKADTPG
jgi:peroxiredoxin Q/BCP